MWLWVWHCDMNICNLGTWAGSIHVRGAPAPIMLTSPISIAVWCLRGAAGRVLMYLIIDSTPSYERWMNLQYILKFLKYIICIDYSVENKIIFFLNSLFLNSCSLKYYYTASEEPQLRLRAVLPTSLYCIVISMSLIKVMCITRFTPKLKYIILQRQASKWVLWKHSGQARVHGIGSQWILFT